jgi:hypothetical protein
MVEWKSIPEWTSCYQWQWQRRRKADKAKAPEPQAAPQPSTPPSEALPPAADTASNWRRRKGVVQEIADEITRRRSTIPSDIVPYEDATGFTVADLIAVCETCGLPLEDMDCVVCRYDAAPDPDCELCGGSGIIEKRMCPDFVDHIMAEMDAATAAAPLRGPCSEASR